MSNRTPPPPKFRPEGPYVGALLRMAYQATRDRLLAALTEKGFADLNQAYLSVFLYPHPHGARPTELAERANMKKQAMNYLLGQLEELGYLERERGEGKRALVYLTRKGWQVVETQWATLQEIEREWAAILGKQRFEQLVGSLRELTSKHRPAKPGHGPASD